MNKLVAQLRLFKKLVLALLLLISAENLRAQSLEDSEAPEPETHLHHRGSSAESCGEMAYFDFANNMCEPTAMAEMPQSRIMVHGNFFGMETVEEGPRGRSIPSLPDMFMIDAGQSWGDSQFLNVEFMGTLEKYTFPADGTPLLLQIGENKSDGTAFIDAQHPHSSPIMGLTFSDTLSLSGQDHVKFFVAPRGETTDGPIAFMHRTTGEVNPEAPLGHHIGQDVGHISSSVVGASWGRGSRTYEISFFNGTEPLPTAVDLPMGPLNSYALRLIQKVSDSAFGMVSAAVVKNPEPSLLSLDHFSRYSGSYYWKYRVGEWVLNHTLIYGLINFYDNAAALNSYLYEGLMEKNTHKFWTRLEVLQRTPNELQIVAPDADSGRYVTAWTLGATESLKKYQDAEVFLGGLVTKDFLPAEFLAAYGGNPMSANLFLQVTGMKMWP